MDETNVNRQLPALSSTVGVSKVEVMRRRLLDINPDLQLTVREQFLQPDGADGVEELLAAAPCGYVVDCIDTVAPKVRLLREAHRLGRIVVSSMGAGGKMDPSRVKVCDISQTHNDKLAKVVRKRLNEAGVPQGVTVVFSDETIRLASVAEADSARFKRSYYGTISYLPALFGLHLASFVVRDVLGDPVDMYRRPAMPGDKKRRTNKKKSGKRAVPVTQAPEWGAAVEPLSSWDATPVLMFSEEELSAGDWSAAKSKYGLDMPTGRETAPACGELTGNTVDECKAEAANWINNFKGRNGDNASQPTLGVFAQTPAKSKYGLDMPTGRETAPACGELTGNTVDECKAEAADWISNFKGRAESANNVAPVPSPRRAPVRSVFMGVTRGTHEHVGRR